MRSPVKPLDRPTVKRAKWALATLFLVDGIGFGTWAAHVPVFKQFLHLENGSLTFVLVSLILGAIISMPITGQLIHHFGSRRVARVSAVIYVLMVALLAQASSLSVLILFAGLFGGAKGAFDVAVNAQAVTVQKQYGAPIMSFFQGCWSAGGLLGAAAASLMLQHGGTARTDISCAAAVLALATLWAVRPLILDEDRQTAAPSKPARFLWPDAPLLRIAAVGFFGLMAEGAIGDWASVYLHSDVGVTLSLAAAGYAAYSIAMAAGRFSGDWLAQHVSGSRILRGSGLLMAAGIGCALLFPSWWPAVAGLMLTGIGIANVVPVIWGAAGRDTRMGAGPAISTVTTIGYLGFLTGPPIIGSLSVAVGLRLAMLVIVLAGLIVAAGPVFLSVEPAPSKQNDQVLAH